jgi:hypothetical protein
MKSIGIYMGLEDEKEKYQLLIGNTLISRENDSLEEESLPQASEAFSLTISDIFQKFKGKYGIHIRNGKRLRLIDSTNELEEYNIIKLKKDQEDLFRRSLFHNLNESVQFPKLLYDFQEAKN